MYRSVLVTLLLLSGAAGCGAGDLTLPGPGEPASLNIVGGDRQQGVPGELVPEPLIVELVDGVGQPVSGRVVSFQFLDPVAGATVDPGTGATDAAGRVAVRARLGQETGAQPLEAFVTTPGEDLRVRFDLRATAPDPPGGGEGGGVTPPAPPPDNGNPGPGGDGGGNNGGGSVGGGGNGGGGGQDGGGREGDDGGGHGGHGHGHDKDKDKGGGKGKD
jgi:hypothetical protein